MDALPRTNPGLLLIAAAASAIFLGQPLPGAAQQDEEGDGEALSDFNGSSGFHKRFGLQSPAGSVLGLQ